MITTAQISDLDLPEFAAFHSVRVLPHMRRWELPFALFQSRLANTTTVLDCSINSENLQQQIAILHPNVLYRRFNPIQDGRFARPFGQPDEGFDRVICVNTLEHLLQPQREILIASMARKLKAGGRLILTSDYYFDSAWREDAFLASGMMKQDRQEVFNGFNKVTPQEWLALCRRHGLQPLDSTVAEPLEGDPALYLNKPPFVHACIGGVFYKPPRIEPPARRVVMALLTWNKRDVSIESVRAYIQEARMLRRLGHEPLICVCDNGSIDGTPEALRALEAEIDVPFHFIYNTENRGSSIARNQIIDCLLERDAHYILFIDGDIEVVPFSSYAMLRYMENAGSRLGCVGADYSGWSRSRAEITPTAFSLQGYRFETTNMLAWTQYGMFRREIFQAGVRFDEAGPFGGPGWGFEDNDLAFQMDVKGFVNQRFYGMTYLHRDARSSVVIMRKQGIDPQVLYARRKQYMIEKWAGVPRINDGPLRYVRSVTM